MAGVPVGAQAPEGVGNDAIDREEPAFEARLRRHLAARQRIATFAIGLLEGRSTVALDVGTTTYLLVRLLVDRPGIKIFRRRSQGH